MGTAGTMETIRKKRFKIFSVIIFITRGGRNSSLPVLTGVRIKRVILEKIYVIFVGTNKTVGNNTLSL